MTALFDEKRTYLITKFVNTVIIHFYIQIEILYIREFYVFLAIISNSYVWVLLNLCQYNNIL